MDKFSHLPNSSKVTILCVSLLAIPISIFFVRRFYKRYQYRKEKESYPADTVILHQVGRGPYAPSLSPFPVKLETYLRFAKIPYQNDLSGRFSSKGKTPWMTYNGVEVADSQFCIDFLNKKLEIDLNDHISDEQRCVGRAFQKMLEENTYWALVCERWVNNHDNTKFMADNLGFPHFLMSIIRRRLKSSLYAQGMGRHTKEEIEQIAYDDLKAFSIALGSKRYFFGDKPCQYDCCYFGMLSQAVWHFPDSYVERLVHNEFTNIRDYCYRMRDEFWLDWNECITKPPSTTKS